MWLLLVFGPAWATGFGPPITSVELELLRPDGKSFAVHKTTEPQDGDEVVIPDGAQAWQLRLHRHEYEGRLEICADLARWGTDGEGQGRTRACVVLPGRDTPEATTVEKGADVQLRMSVSRRKRT